LGFFQRLCQHLSARVFRRLITNSTECEAVSSIFWQDRKAVLLSGDSTGDKLCKKNTCHERVFCFTFTFIYSSLLTFVLYTADFRLWGTFFPFW
jgi:hypothetical protein